MPTPINWKYPKPRSQWFKGFIDRLIGPGATNAELILQFGAAILAAIMLFIYIKVEGLGLNLIQIIIACYLAFDIVGGIATNSTSTAKRWWHREKRRHFKNHFKFLFFHFYMPLLIVLGFQLPWTFFFTIYGYLLIAGSIIILTPLYLRRPVAFLCYIGALLIHLYIFQLPPAIQWFIPLIFLKLLMSHLIQEEPYRPVEE